MQLLDFKKLYNYNVISKIYKNILSKIGRRHMKKLDKILLLIIIVLTVALVAMTVAFFRMRKTAKENLQSFLESERQIVELKDKINS